MNNYMIIPLVVVTVTYVGGSSAGLMLSPPQVEIAHPEHQSGEPKNFREIRAVTTDSGTTIKSGSPINLSGTKFIFSR